MSLTVYGASLSPFVRKVRVVLHEKGLGYELDQVNVFNPPDWFLEISPLKRIPVLRDTDAGEDATLADSSAICAYLERKVPAPALLPGDAFSYGRALWFEEYADSEMAANIGLGCFRPVVVARLMGRDPDTDKAEETCREKLPRYFAYLEKELTGKTYFVDDTFSLADIAIGTQFANLRHTGFLHTVDAYPNLKAFVDRVHGRDSFKTCIEEETALLRQFGFSDL